MSFFEVEFPTKISFGATGGSTFFTNVNEGFSGYEQRNRNWAKTRGKWNIAIGTPADMDDQRENFVALLQSFFLVVGGRADGFRFKDFTDYKATGQTLEQLTATTFQLQRTYTIGGRSYVRKITKPITSSVTDYRGVQLANTVVVYDTDTPISTMDYSVDHTTGIVTITAALGSPVDITADFQYHYPVRFNTDELDLRLIDSNTAEGHPIVRIDNIEIVEIRIAA